MRKYWKRLTDWEQWPFFLVYSPLIFVWIYYAIRARAVWYFSPVNPHLEFSGFEGEGKKEMYALIPPDYYPTTVYVSPDQSFCQVLTAIETAGLQFPFVLKPDRGMQGILFRIVRNADQLEAYHSVMPVDYVIQALVNLPLEFSVFHIRYPGQNKGELTGFIMKKFLSVKGDGRSTLRTLISKHPKANKRRYELIAQHVESINNVIPAGERFYLSYAGNHNQGAHFINLHNEIDDSLREVFNKISLECKSFYYGRYDIKCTSLEDLKQGKNISILEFNGTGAEPNHIYDCGMTYRQALQEIAKHWEHMYKIGKINNRQGVPYWGFNKGRKYLKDARKMFNLLRKCDMTIDNVRLLKPDVLSNGI